ncbi:MAG TPA: sensor domain-containing diguanylate cyclase [Solirubrobacteraceae bacterium]|nr:sensor domain-containing diguanylate cyclase [Solirubrobacteraceae bacterium]
MPQVSRLKRASRAYTEAAADAGACAAAGELSLIARRITTRTGAETGVIVVFNPSDRLLHVMGAWGTAPGGELPVALRAGDGFVGRVLESGRSAAEPIDPRHDPSLGVAESRAELTYALGAAIRPPGGPPGALCLGFASRPPDEALTLWRAESYARLAALCLHEKGTLDGLLAPARLDGLTGCLNYASVRAELEREIRRCERNRGQMSCCFIDLDHFKHVNDRHGHLYGNRVLAEVGEALRHGVRAGDTIGRYGGDEFLAILTDADEAAARALAERLRAKILATRPGGIGERLDTSIGVAQWEPGLTADDLLGAADAALLRAKEGGGGIVANARSSAEPGPTAVRWAR